MEESEQSKAPAIEEPQPSAPPPSSRPVQTRIDFILNHLRLFYNKKYYRETLKSIIFFLIGLKLATECYHIVFPIKDYEPFKAICGGR